LYVDDEEIGVIRLARGVYDVKGPTSGGLFVGGLPDEIPLADMAPNSKPLFGIVKELALNRKLILLEQKHFFDSNQI
jgi:hypothetical protein